jgi:hypothetical protein
MRKKRRFFLCRFACVFVDFERFFVRDATKEELDPKANEGHSRKIESDLEQIRAALLRWCKINFSEAFMFWVHLKAIRVFVEAVLRFGLPSDFQAILILVRFSLFVRFSVRLLIATV